MESQSITNLILTTKENSRRITNDANSGYALDWNSGDIPIYNCTDSMHALSANLQKEYDYLALMLEKEIQDITDIFNDDQNQIDTSYKTKLQQIHKNLIPAYITSLITGTISLCEAYYQTISLKQAIFSPIIAGTIVATYTFIRKQIKKGQLCTSDDQKICIEDAEKRFKKKLDRLTARYQKIERSTKIEENAIENMITNMISHDTAYSGPREAIEEATGKKPSLFMTKAEKVLGQLYSDLSKINEWKYSCTDIIDRHYFNERNDYMSSIRAYLTSTVSTTFYAILGNIALSKHPSPISILKESTLYGAAIAAISVYDETISKIPVKYRDIYTTMNASLLLSTIIGIKTGNPYLSLPITLASIAFEFGKQQIEGHIDRKQLIKPKITIEEAYHNLDKLVEVQLDQVRTQYLNI